MNILRGLSTIFSFVSAIALIASHGFRLPKWPFTQERWNPKPTELKKEEKAAEEEAGTEEQPVQDESAEAIRRLNKRCFNVEREIDGFGRGKGQHSNIHGIKMSRGLLK